jgi:predicted nucleic acid-binding protein
MTTLVLDAWAVLAWLQGEEPAASRVDAVFRAARGRAVRLWMSPINLGEVYYTVARRLGPGRAEAVLRTLTSGPLRLLSLGEEDVWDAARVKAKHAVSFADAFAVASALRTGGRLMTGDPEILAAAPAIRGLRLKRLARRP